MASETTTESALARHAKVIKRQIDLADGVVIARVWDSSRAFDIALLRDAHPGVVVRCVEQPMHHDHTALTTMIAEGDFTEAFIVYTEESVPPLEGPIPTYPLSRIDELALALAKETAK